MGHTSDQMEQMEVLKINGDDDDDDIIHACKMLIHIQKCLPTYSPIYQHQFHHLADHINLGPLSNYIPRTVS